MATNLMWKVGDITVTRVVEMESVHASGGPTSGLPNALPEAIREISWLIPDFATPEGHLRMGVQALLVQTPGMRLIVDTCVGNDKTRAIPNWNQRHSNFLGDLAAAGWPRESVDGVLCTHLHVDHVGWNTMLVDGEWRPTFPNAKYYMARRELEHWSDERERTTARAADSAYVQSMMDSNATYLDSVKPIVDAGLAVLLETDAQIATGITLLPTPGHTPGHVSVLLESNGESAVITGDMMHHPCQIARPDWPSAFDSDNIQSCDTRRAFLARFADTGTLVIGTHFGGPAAGRVLREGSRYRLFV